MWGNFWEILKIYSPGIFFQPSFQVQIVYKMMVLESDEWYSFGAVAFTPMAYPLKSISVKFQLRYFARKSLAHLRRSWKRSTALRAHSAQFEKFKWFINDEMVYRVTNKNHHSKTWSIHQPMLLLLLICKSIMIRQCSLRGSRGVRGLSHGQRRCSHLRDPRGLWRLLQGL